MATTHGQIGTFSLEDSAASTLRLIGVNVTSTTLNRSNDTHDTTTYGQTAHTFVAGLTNATIALSGYWDATATVGSATVLDSLIGLLSVTVGWEHGPAGSATGKVKYSGEAVLQDLAYTTPVADLVSFTATLQVTGAITKGTY